MKYIKLFIGQRPTSISRPFRMYYIAFVTHLERMVVNLGRKFMQCARIIIIEFSPAIGNILVFVCI